MAKSRKKLGEILYRHKLVSKEDLTKAIKKSKADNKRLGETLIEMKLASEKVVTQALARQAGIKFFNLEKEEIDPEALSLIPLELIKKHRIIPIEQNNGLVKMIVSNPDDFETLDMLRFRLNADLKCYFAVPRLVDEYIENLGQEQEEESEEGGGGGFGADDESYRASIDATAAELEEMGHAIEGELRRAAEADEDDDGPVIRLVNLIIDEAVNMGASDIHIEPMSDRVRIRYRNDGVCIERDNIPKNMQAPLLARFKILSGIDITEKRVPQDGRIKRTVGDQDIDFRVSTLPAYHGESTVLRILRPESVNIGIQALGFEGDHFATFQNIIKRPNGIFLVTGPTGSGKTTTLYSALKELNRPDKKIITAEDPVEYNVAGINQCQVRTEIGLTFDSILRSMLRQAPNIILIGEIRDGIVADIAIQAALTGHLVFSTLHTNDAPSAITRLIDMGVKPFLVASSIQAIMAQRLLRLICKNCKTIDTDPDPHYLRLLNIKPEDIKKNPIYKGKGCPRCQGTGYKGRVAAFELMEMNNEIRDLAFQRAPSGEIRKAARASGMKTLLDDAKRKVFKGITTPQEVARITQSEGLMVDLDEEEE